MATEVLKLQQQLRSVQGRLRAQTNTRSNDTNYSTVHNVEVTFVPVGGGANPATASMLADNTCISHWHGIVAPSEFVRHWSKHLPLETGRVIVQFAFVCEITAGQHADLFVDSRAITPNSRNADNALRTPNNFTSGNLIIPRGTTQRVVFSLAGKQETIASLKKYHARRLKTGTVTGLKEAANPTVFNRGRNNRLVTSQWKSEVQDDPILPIHPSFTIEVVDETLAIAPFRDLPGQPQPYVFATVRWCSAHYLPV